MRRQERSESVDHLTVEEVAGEVRLGRKSKKRERKIFCWPFLSLVDFLLFKRLITLAPFVDSSPFSDPRAAFVSLF